jgi:hypothetical protein
MTQQNRLNPAPVMGAEPAEPCRTSVSTMFGVLPGRDFEAIALSAEPAEPFP